MEQMDIKDLIKDLVARVVERRKYLKISQLTLALKVGISRFKLMKIEHNKAEFTLEEYLKCCIFLDLLPFEM